MRMESTSARSLRPRRPCKEACSRTSPLGETCMPFRPQRTHSAMTDAESGDFSCSNLSAIGAIVSFANLSATSTSVRSSRVRGSLRPRVSSTGTKSFSHEVRWHLSTQGRSSSILRCWRPAAARQRRRGCAGHADRVRSSPHASTGVRRGRDLRLFQVIDA
jgi:hypothetical protein